MDPARAERTAPRTLPPSPFGGDAPDQAAATGETTTLRRLTGLTAARLALYLALLGAVAGFHLRGDATAYPSSLRIVALALSAAFASTGIFAAWLRRRQGLAALAWTQLVVDQAFWTVLVYLSGGPGSGATTFYGLSCVLAAVTLGATGAIVGALLGAALFLALVAGLATGAIAEPIDQPAFVWRPEQDVYSTLVSLLALFVVALLAAYLARRLQAESGRLALVTERAERAERLAALGRIATALAHEIRNPLGSISGSIEIIREAPGLGDDERRLCEIVRSEVARLNDLVSDMMDLARPRAPTIERTDLALIAQDVVRLARRSGRAEHDVPLDYEGEASVEIAIDAALVRQLVWNLVRNAIQASGAGAPVHVRVRRAQAGGVVEVEDRGAGIAPEMRGRIFDAFVTTRAHGVGIGLAVVKQIADAHGAAIEVDDTPGGGTTFRVLFPGASA
jgi:signal transduction histidine kinase